MKKIIIIVFIYSFSWFHVYAQPSTLSGTVTCSTSNGIAEGCLLTANLRVTCKLGWMNVVQAAIKSPFDEHVYLSDVPGLDRTGGWMGTLVDFDYTLTASENEDPIMQYVQYFIQMMPESGILRTAPGHDNSCDSLAGGGDGGVGVGGCPEPPGGGWFLSKAGSPIPGVIDDCSDLPGGSPIVIDLGQDGFNFGGPENPVLFDLLGYGQTPLLLQWVSPNDNDAFLIIDINGNGVVDNGAELFGSGTRLILEEDENGEHPLALNGYIGLQQYDNPILGGNNDGLITEEDSIWSDLFVWLDHNADGVSTEDEILSMPAVGLTRLDITPKESRNHDQNGNALIFWSWTYDDNLQGHNKFKMVDVFFKLLD